MHQMAQLEAEHRELQEQLAAAREAAQSATGRSRAVSRQLAELQTQYAAVAGLRDQYRQMQRQLNEERATREAALEDTSAVREQLASTEAALAALQQQSIKLSDQLTTTRRTLATIDLVDTPTGRRWLWLFTSLILHAGRGPADRHHRQPLIHARSDGAGWASTRTCSSLCAPWSSDCSAEDSCPRGCGVSTRPGPSTSGS